MRERKGRGGGGREGEREGARSFSRGDTGSYRVPSRKDKSSRALHHAQSRTQKFYPSPRRPRASPHEAHRISSLALFKTFLHFTNICFTFFFSFRHRILNLYVLVWFQRRYSVKWIPIITDGQIIEWNLLFRLDRFLIKIFVPFWPCSSV